MVGAPPLADGHTERVRFDRIADGGAGAMGLYVINIVGLDVGARVDLFKQGALCSRARYRKPRFAAIGIDCRIGDDG